jgi:hypothetical protein
LREHLVLARLGALEVSIKEPSRAPISFEAEQADTRLARRKRNWIADVAIK